MKDAKSNEFLTCEWDLPTKGERIVTRCFDKAYVGELTKYLNVPIFVTSHY